LTQAGRLLLIKTRLASILVYLLSLFKFPRWAIDLINSHMANCFWDDFEGHTKLHFANWHLICVKKIVWGLGGAMFERFKSLPVGLLGQKIY
jgi:hypothetical protein